MLSLSIFAKTPLLRLLLFLILGIILGIKSIDNDEYYLVLGLLTVFAGAFLFFRERGELWVGFLINVSILLLAAHYSSSVLKKKQPPYIPQKVLVRGYISDPVQLKKRSIKAEINLIDFRYNDTIWGHDEKVIAYFEIDSLAKQLEIGDVVVFKNRLNKVAGPANFWEFNYAKILNRKSIFLQQYIQAENWTLGSKQIDNFSVRIAKLRQSLVAHLAKQGVKDQQLAFLSALLIGYKYELNAETKSAFATAGATHVLAVSGLHVGIIFVMINYVLAMFLFLKQLRWLRLSLALTMLWAYALLTGLPPSIFRASIMFSVLAIGMELKRLVNIYNSLSFAALFLLILNPLNLFHLGFQFSFLAVVAIVYFQPKIAQFIELPWKWTKPVTSLLAVTLAAQLGTSPLVLFYFKQFPVYFFISNLVVVPLVGLFIWLAFVLVFASILPEAGQWLGELINSILGFFLQWIGKMEHLPFALVKDFNFTEIQTWASYMAIILLAYFLYRKEYLWLKWSMFLLFIVVGVFFTEVSERKSGKYLLWGSNKKKVELGVVVNGNVTIFSDELEKEWVERRWQSVGNYFYCRPRCVLWSDTLLHDGLCAKGKIIHAGETAILFLTKKLELNENQKQLSIDWLVINQMVKFEGVDILSKIRCKHLVVGKGCRKKDVLKWQQICEQRGIAFYNLKEVDGLCYSERRRELIRF